MAFKKIALFAALQLIIFSAYTQNRIFLKNQESIDVTYLDVLQDYIIVLKKGDSLRTERRIPLDLIDSLQCNNTKFILNAYDVSSKYKALFKNTKPKPPQTAKSKVDTIRSSNSGSGYTYQGEFFRGRQLNELLKTEDACISYIKRAQANKIAYYILGYPGAFLLGYSLGYAVTGNEINVPMLCIGGGLTIVSIPFFVLYAENLKLAIRKFNEVKIQKGN